MNFFKKLFSKEESLAVETPITDETARADMWINKFPKKEVIYNAEDNLPHDVRNFIFDRSYVLEKIVQKYKLRGADDDDTMLKCCEFVQGYITYKSDTDTHAQPEFWQYPEDTVGRRAGDCIAEYEELYTLTGIKKAKDIEIGDTVLTYDFFKKEFTYKPIINLWDKGIKKVKRVHFRNGQHIDVTDEHHMLARINQSGSSVYEKIDLRDVDLTRWWKRKVPLAKNIPYTIYDIEWLSEDLCLVIGHYIAEGWVEGGHVCSSGYELVEDIIPILEQNFIPFSEYTNNSGVPCIRFLKSDFKEYLKLFKQNSFDIHIPEEIFHLPKSKLEKFIYGMWLGDGHNGSYLCKDGTVLNKPFCYSTSSEQLSKDIQRLGLQLGRSFHIWKQIEHGGFGKHPIYRITYNPNSYFLKDYGYADISEVSISFIEDIGYFQTYDWEVKDTHNFVFKNGVITSQCEDGALLMKSLTLIAGIPDWKVKIIAGDVNGGGHAYCTYIRSDDKQVVMDWCYWPNNKPINNRPPIEEEENYYDIWFSFNHDYTYAETKIKYSKGKISKTRS